MAAAELQSNPGSGEEEPTGEQEVLTAEQELSRRG